MKVAGEVFVVFQPRFASHLVREQKLFRSCSKAGRGVFSVCVELTDPAGQAVVRTFAAFDVVHMKFQGGGGL